MIKIDHIIGIYQNDKCLEFSLTQKEITQINIKIFKKISKKRFKI